jgi:hypothetical protein
VQEARLNEVTKRLNGRLVGTLSSEYVDPASQTILIALLSVAEKARSIAEFTSVQI